MTDVFDAIGAGEREALAGLDGGLFGLLAGAGLAGRFRDLMAARAELYARTLPRCVDRRAADMTAGAISICYELADNAAAALAGAAPLAGGEAPAGRPPGASAGPGGKPGGETLG